MMHVAVFSGSALGPQSHQGAAAAVGHRLAVDGIGLVYGGGKVGLMGLVADAALEAGGSVTGVMPQHLVDAEVAHDHLTQLYVVGTMHERKAKMVELADAFVALPGGPGTLDELFEVFTWARLGLHCKPVALLDVDAFYGPLLTQLDQMTSGGYLSSEHRASVSVAQTVPALMESIFAQSHTTTS